eukprot:TRINITY_DN595_c0_g1_i1.p1 TRINITY_DN595_c0_g1~~TRINITY_DN595_c0_g1_i1.p1  ORF type:complete len:228 (+),score=44.28 TRINITY_DN595_c0_g1_i1:447-1130(+)
MKFIVLALFALALVTLVHAQTACNDGDKTNPCADSGSSGSFCIANKRKSANETAKACMACRPYLTNKDCDCPVGQICWNGQDEKYGTCVAPDTAQVGKNCDPSVTTLTMKKDDNEKLFCGQYTEKADPNVPNSKFTFHWVGDCVHGKCVRCTPGWKFFGAGTCPDMRQCIDGSGYVDSYAYWYSWSSMGANALAFLTFALFIVLIPVSCVFCFKKYKGETFVSIGPK